MLVIVFFLIGTAYAMKPYIPSEVNGFADVSYSKLPAHIKRKGLNIPYMIFLPRDIDMPISTIFCFFFFPELAEYARFRKHRLPLLGTVFTRHYVPVEIRMIIIDLCYYI